MLVKKTSCIDFKLYGTRAGRWWWISCNNKLIFFFFCSQAALAIIQASGVTPKKEPPKDDAKALAEAREARQYAPYQGQIDNEVVVDIEDDEKKQYYETNYDTSKLSFLRHNSMVEILESFRDAQHIDSLF